MEHLLAERRWSELKALIQQIDKIDPPSERLERMVQSDGFDQVINSLRAEIEDQETVCK